MSKQLLIYETAVPVSASRHADVALQAGGDYAFSAGINAVPLMAVEFPRAAVEYAIVFTVAGDEVTPAVVLGVRDNQNLYLSPEGQWTAKYVPAFIRRYPFVFSRSEDGKTLTLCIDESHPGVNREGRGQRLFDAERKPTPYVQRVLKFLQEYQTQYERTRLFGRRLRELGLLDEMRAQVTTPAGKKLSLSGFHCVSRARLRQLEGEAATKLLRSDELELLFLQMHSLRNFGEVKDRLIGTLTENEIPAVMVQGSTSLQ
jgi:hypothetical protein